MWNHPPTKVRFGAKDKLFDILNINSIILDFFGKKNLYKVFSFKASIYFSSYRIKYKGG